MISKVQSGIDYSQYSLEEQDKWEIEEILYNLESNLDRLIALGAITKEDKDDIVKLINKEEL